MRRHVVGDDEVGDASLRGRLESVGQSFFEAEAVRDDEVGFVDRLDVLRRWFEIVRILPVRDDHRDECCVADEFVDERAEDRIRDDD